MLNNEARTNLQTIQKMISQLWGDNCELSGPEIKQSPYPEFELTLRLYRKVQVGIYYDRSAIDIGIMQDGKYVLLQKFTPEKVVRGMAAMKPENLYRNFYILDKVAKRLSCEV